MFPIATTNFAARLCCVAFSRSISVVLLSAIFAGHAFARESVPPHRHPGCRRSFSFVRNSTFR